MKKIVPMDPQILCEKIDLQSQVGDFIIPGQAERVSAIRKVVDVSPAALKRNIEIGDIVVTRGIQYPKIPSYLTENDEVPFDTKDSVEILDVSQIIAVYKEEEKNDWCISLQQVDQILTNYQNSKLIGFYSWQELKKEKENERYP